VAAVSEAMGRPFMPHQREFMDVFLEVQSSEAGDPDPGAWAYEDATETGPRRLGKTAKISPLIAHRARMIDRARMFMTAQNRDKARSRWLDVTDDMLASALRDDVRRKIGNMNEELRWIENASTFVPFAPNEDGLHSETPDLVLIDELWAFDAEQARQIKAGYVPAFATNPGQALKMSTAGGPKSAWLNQARVNGRIAVERGVRLGVMYYEHSLPDEVDGVPVGELEDEALIQACIRHHPAVCHFPGCPGPANRRPCPHGFTVRASRIAAAFTEMADRGEFVRAYGNRSADDSDTDWRAIEKGVWMGAGYTKPIPSDATVALGFDVDPGRREGSISAAWRSPGGTMFPELLACKPGTRWIAGTLLGYAERNRPAAVAVNNAGPARDIADEIAKPLEDMGVALVRVSQWDYSAACNRHHDELSDGTWKHRGEQAVTAAAASVAWRKSGQSRAWDASGDPITALASQTLAGWAFDHAPEPATPLPKFWMG
jgi:hypothetical protein